MENIIKKHNERMKQLDLSIVSGSNLYTADQVKALIQECCGEVYCEDGTLKGKSPAELYKWIETKKL